MRIDPEDASARIGPKADDGCFRPGAGRDRRVVHHARQRPGTWPVRAGYTDGRFPRAGHPLWRAGRATGTLDVARMPGQPPGGDRAAMVGHGRKPFCGRGSTDNRPWIFGEGDARCAAGHGGRAGDAATTLVVGTPGPAGRCPAERMAAADRRSPLGAAVVPSSTGQPDHVRRPGGPGSWICPKGGPTGRPGSLALAHAGLPIPVRLVRNGPGLSHPSGSLMRSDRRLCPI